MNPRSNFSPLLTSLFLVFIIAVSGCAQKNRWDLVWSEEFDNTGKPNEEFWDYETGYVRNRELQYYTDQLQNAKVENGYCTLTARLEKEDSITSASINTLGKVDLLYGRLEVRAKIPSALGTWPAIWLLGTNKHDMGWPACGEIDVMEHVGFEPGLIHANIHTKAYNHMINTNKGNRIEVGEPWADYHIYALEWFEDHMDFFYDDSLYFSYQNDMQGDHDTWPFDKPHYLLINLAYGGSWGGRQGVDTSQLPLKFEVDYVRYYQLNKED
jgi:beta-glucanase (GH16 family)